MAEIDPGVPVLADDAILLHIGPHKTGTTALQAALATARPRLRAAGIIYPLRSEACIEHNREASAAIRRELGWDGRTVSVDFWTRLAERVRGYDGRAVISSEVFCEASEADANRVLDDLGRDRVTVLVTLRPLERLLSSSWQQYIKSGYRMRYVEWLEDVLTDRDHLPVTRSFWLRNNHEALVTRWCEAVGDPRRVCVLVADRANPRGLFDAAEDLLRLPRTSLNPSESGPRNRSLTLPEVELLRQTNRQVFDRLDSRDYELYIKRGAVKRLIDTRTPAPDEPRVRTPAWAVQRAREFSRSDVAAIAALGVPVLGELASLAPDTPVAGTVDARDTRDARDTQETQDTSATETVAVVDIGLAAAFVAGLADTAVAEERRVRERLTPKPISVSASVPAPARAPAAAVRPGTIGGELDRVIAGARRRARRVRRRLKGRGR